MACERLLSSLSLANLLGLHIWLVLFRQGQEAPLPGLAFAGAIAAVLSLAALFWLASFLVVSLPHGRVRRSTSVLGLMLIWTLVLWAGLKPSLQQSVQQVTGMLTPMGVGLCLALLGLACLLLALRYATRAIQLMTLAALVLSPYAAVNLLRSGWELSQRGVEVGQTQRQKVPELVAGDQRIRTVVLLFDEFDYELAFEPDVRRDALPTIDGLRNKALFATHAYPPMHSTAMSLPAMLAGKLVRGGEFSNTHPGDVELEFDDGRRERWSVEPSVFTDLRARGLTSLRMNDALLPHARLAGAGEADVVVAPADGGLNTLWDHTASHFVTMATVLPFFKSAALDLRLGDWLGLESPSVHVSKVADQIVELAGDAGSDLLLLHILLPHMPVVIDRSVHSFGRTTSSDYRDNFLGVDEVIRRVMDRLHERDRADRTNLVVVSDHFYRNKRAAYGLGDHRTPFIAWFGGDSAPAGTFDKPFNTVLLRPMLDGIVSGEIRTSAQLANWLNTHATFGESPLTIYRKGW